MTIDSERTNWQRRIADCEKSGLSIGEFCKRNGISEARFYYWKKKIKQFGSNLEVIKNPDKMIPEEIFKEVKIESSPRELSGALRKMIITTSYGCRLEVPL